MNDPVLRAKRNQQANARYQRKKQRLQAIEITEAEQVIDDVEPCKIV
jgi:hypothetical protein